MTAAGRFGNGRQSVKPEMADRTSAVVQEPRAVAAALSLVHPLLGRKRPRLSVGVHRIAAQRMRGAPRRRVHDDPSHIVLLVGDPRHQHAVTLGTAEAVTTIRSDGIHDLTVATLYRPVLHSYDRDFAHKARMIAPECIHSMALSSDGIESAVCGYSLPGQRICPEAIS